MHADPQAKARGLSVQGRLDGDGTAECLHGAGELHQEPVAHGFEQAPTVGSRQGLDHRGAQRPNAGQRVRVVRTHLG